MATLWGSGYHHATRTGECFPAFRSLPTTSVPTGTQLRPIPSFDRRQLLMATGSLQLWQRTARLPARRERRPTGGGPVAREPVTVSLN
ncbi:hypothetical protein ETAA8_65570 [Anatilimnocola aggregata]|uniref:Uncharacterized protein n=1 Tax=Anatilimnocola aggregata TaxID=2528021 RepID=A0A517YMF1_9BACT|nr:hypothetical protein ETAA8_65570 [Anatilimnocola aggregata]